MFHPMTPAQTCVGAWIGAAQYLVTAGGEAYNLVVDIDDPTRHTEQDKAAIMHLDRFLRERRAYPVVTVANTIFPQDLYRRYGPGKFVDEYLRSYDAIRMKGWGRYFERMVRWPTADGQTCRPLHDLVEQLSQWISSKQTFRNVYEMTLFDPARDARRPRGRQCLSFLSFKLHSERGLMLTAMYRNHHYIARALGNFIGLGNLMAYIAKQVDITVGPLTCISTHAVVDTAPADPDKDGHGDACRGWKITEARELVATLAASRSGPAPKEGANATEAT